MLVQKTGCDSVVILLEREDNDSEEYLCLCARKALEYKDELNLRKPEISAYSSGGKKLVFVRIPGETGAIFGFKTAEDMIDAVRAICAYGSADAELFSDGNMVYIKASDRRSLSILREYGEYIRGKNAKLKKLGGTDELKKLCGG